MQDGMLFEDEIQLFLCSLPITRLTTGLTSSQGSQPRGEGKLLTGSRLHLRLTPRARPWPIPLKVPPLRKEMGGSLKRFQLHERCAIPTP